MTMKSGVALSIIVANYNNELFIKDCLDNCLNQTYQDFEIIVVDDRSTDNSPIIIKEYEKKYPEIVKGVHLSENRGVAYCRHAAILFATGEYITTLDSDDYYYDMRKLQEEMALIVSYKEKYQKDICVFSNTVLVTKDKEYIEGQESVEAIKDGKIFDYIITRTCKIPRDFIATKSAYFEVGGYDFSIKMYEDWDLKIRLASKYEFYYSGVNGTAYRRHGTGLSSAPPEIHLEWLDTVFKKNLHLIEKDKRSEIRERFDIFRTQICRKIVSQKSDGQKLESRV